jgi:carbamoyl-phosphate synthase/aspartate carbamoyltransferase/dihydroorotase
MYVNDTFGTLRIERLPSLAAHFAAWPRGRPIVLHAEDLSVAAGIGLAAAHNRSVHFAHVSRAEEIRLIVAAKQAGLRVTCEVAPHHLLLTESDLSTLGPFGEVRPRLATDADRDALWEHIDVIDCIATDHAPHTRAEKESASPPPGMPGLETSLPLMLTAVHDGRLSLDRLIEMMSHRPAELFGIGTPRESEVYVEFGPEWTLPDRGYQTKCDWSPFAGWPVRARVRRVELRGITAWEDGELKSEPGMGRLIPGAEV